MNQFDVILPFFPVSVQKLIMDETISDLMIVGEKVFVDRGGASVRVPNVLVNRKQIDIAVQNIARLLGDDINKHSPILDSRLPDGSRVAAMFAPCSIDGTTLTIRKFVRQFTTDELIEQGCLPLEVRDTVVAAIGNRKNVLVSGGTGAGKTTLLNAFIAHIPAEDRLLVIEKPAELRILHDNAVRWESVDGLPGRPAITTSQLLKAALRHRPDRIILGEVRDHAAYDLMQALNTGHSGSFSTIHADSASQALYRLSGLAVSAYPNLDHSFVRSEVAAAIHFIVHVQRFQEGRRVTQLLQVLGYDSSAERFNFN